VLQSTILAQRYRFWIAKRRAG